MTVPLPRALRSAALLPLLAALAACAVSRVNADGSIEHWGWAHVRVPAAEGRPGAVRFDVAGLGLFLSSTPAGSGISLGYASQSLTVVRHDALVCLPSLAAAPIASEGDPP